MIIRHCNICGKNIIGNSVGNRVIVKCDCKKSVVFKDELLTPEERLTWDVNDQNYSAKVELKLLEIALKYYDNIGKCNCSRGGGFR